MNQLSGAEAFVRMLQLHGVATFSGCAATPACRSTMRSPLDHGISHILTRDERSAAYMADAYARVTGRVGVARDRPAAAPPTFCRAWSRPTRARSAARRSPPTSRSAARGRYVLTELDQEAMYRPLTKWNRVIDRGADPGSVARRVPPR